MVLPYFLVTFTSSDESGTEGSVSNSSEDDLESRATATKHDMKRKFVMTQENCVVGDKLRMSLRQQTRVVNATATALGEASSSISHVTAYRHRKKSR